MVIIPFKPNLIKKSHLSLYIAHIHLVNMEYVPLGLGYHFILFVFSDTNSDISPFICSGLLIMDTSY
jgi:hypothetical protein